MPSAKKSAKRTPRGQADLAGEVWKSFNPEATARLPHGSWLVLASDSELAMHRIVCHCFLEPSEFGCVDHKISHVRQDDNPILNLIIAKWRLQAWFVVHLDGNKANNAAANLKVVGLGEALQENGDWDLFLMPSEVDNVKRNMSMVRNGLI